MRVNREELLKVLESVTPGLVSRELDIDQSSCLVFYEGRVITFNNEIFCSRESPLGDIEGAVKANPLLTLLSKLDEDEIEVKQSESELLIKGKGRGSGIRMEQEVKLPVESVEVPEDWKSLDPEFSEAVSIVNSCASKDEPVLICVHITPDHIEACDRFQVIRYPLKTNIDKSVLIKATSLKKIVGFDMTEICETDSWLHFRNPSGLIFSCGKYLDKYHDLDEVLTATETTPVVLPGSLEEVISKAEIFSGENAAGNYITVDLRTNKIMIKGEGAIGWYKEMKKVKYDGPDIKFVIDPKLLLEISKKSNQCRVGPDRLFIDTGKFQYMTNTELTEENKDEAA